jgi:hypothetical protein
MTTLNRRKCISMQKKSSRKAISFHQFLQRVKRFISLGEQHLEETHFYVYRTDNHQVLARDIDGYDAAKEKATHLRRQLGLKWDQVKFKAQRTSTMTPGPSAPIRVKRDIDYSPRYNPSKRGHFRGYYDHDGNFHDID